MLTGHYHAWKTGKSLHYAISEDSLMIYQPSGLESPDKDIGPGKVKTVPSRGVLVDFNMSSELDIGQNVQLHAPGALPFMARDLLARIIYRKVGNNPPKLQDKDFYRYDLESFYYILIWVAITYRLQIRTHKTRKAKKNTSPLAKWQNPDLLTVYASKILLDTGLSGLFEELDSMVSEDWRPLWNDWIKPLHLMFAEGFCAANAAHRHGDANFNMATCDGLITFEKFMNVINEVPSGLPALGYV